MKNAKKCIFSPFFRIYRPITQKILVGLIKIYIFLKAQTILYWMIPRIIRLVYRFLFYSHVKLKNCENGQLYIFLRLHPYIQYEHVFMHNDEQADMGISRDNIWGSVMWVTFVHVILWDVCLGA